MREQPVQFVRVSHRARENTPSAYSVLDPRVVKSVLITDDGATVVKRFGKQSFAWSDVQAAYLERRRVTTSLAGFSRISYVRRVLRLLLPKDQVEVDVSEEFPEFDRPDLIEDEFRKHVAVTEVDDIQADRGHWLYKSPLVALPIFLGLGIWLLLENGL